jgi:hypothetical protein
MDDKRYWRYNFIGNFEEILEDLKDSLQGLHRMKMVWDGRGV